MKQQSPVLSIAIIFKDEIRCIERCVSSLRSLRDAVTSELVMIDTGSTDGSRAVAERNADVLADFSWTGDFSAARNAALAHCTGKWILFVDCDEWLDPDITQLVGFLRGSELRWGQANLGMIPIRNYFTKDLESRYSDFLAHRLLRNLPGLSFRGAIHEEPVFQGRPHNVFNLSKTLLHHDGYVDLGGRTGRAKRRRNLPMLRKKLEDNPEDILAMTQYLDIAQDEPDFLDKLRDGVDMVIEKKPRWKEIGPYLLTLAISYGCIRGLPETLEWSKLADFLFPDSVYTRIQANYYLTVYLADRGLYQDSLKRGEAYLKAMNEYEDNSDLRAETIHGPVRCSSEEYPASARLTMARVYANMKQPREALEQLRGVIGGKLEPPQVGAAVRVLGEVFSQNTTDASAVLSSLWESLLHPEQAGFRLRKANLCRDVFYREGMALFEGETDTESQREPWQLFLPLAGSCTLGDAAALMASQASAELSSLLERITEWKHVPARALCHALEQGALFPPPAKVFTWEECLTCTRALSQSPALLEQLALKWANPQEETEPLSRLLLADAALLGILQARDWTAPMGEAAETEWQDTTMALIRAFAQVEARLLPRLYTAEALSMTEALPGFHFTGSICAQTLADIDKGDILPAIRSIREALLRSPELGDMLGYLLKNAEQMIPPESTCENARRMALEGDREKALERYSDVLNEDSEPAELLEAAAYLLQNGGDYMLSYAAFVQLHNAGYYREEILPLLTRFFYEPAVKRLKSQYERNCKALSKYPYLFRRNFPAFENLPLLFYPYDDADGYVAYSPSDALFQGFLNVREERITHYFFEDLSKPILANDIFSQYELEYLRDNVRPSEYIAKDNHIYLHYSSWAEFCAWLQVLNIKPLLDGKKFVFLMEEEESLYPIDFKERFGIDYSQLTPRPIGIQEVNRLIWHVQTTTHNGGDFFNEIFDQHPHLLSCSSIFLSEIEADIGRMKVAYEQAHSPIEAVSIFNDLPPHIARELYLLKKPTEKQWLITWYMRSEWTKALDQSSRIAPALFFQPHFPYMYAALNQADAHTVILKTREEDLVKKSPMFSEFKYIKAFLPLRRFTTSYGGTMRFMLAYKKEILSADGSVTKTNVIPDVIMDRIVTRTFMAADDNRLMRDARVVSFENGKLNPTATFTALCAFLDLPYTPSMKYCSYMGELNPGSTWTNYSAGFDLKSVYKTYDEFTNDSERCFLEYFLRDAYQYYGYDFHYYDGTPMTRERLEALMDGFVNLNQYIYETGEEYFRETTGMDAGDKPLTPEIREDIIRTLAEQNLEQYLEQRKRTALLLLENPRMVSASGLPLHMIPLLELDPALLEHELYH